MLRNIPIIWPIAPLNLHDAALDDVIDVAVADGSIVTFAVIDRTEDGLNFLRL